MSNDEEPLAGGWSTEVRRVGDHVLRTRRPHSATVIRLLRHLDDSGFGAAPVPVEGGFAADGREQLTFLEGASPHPTPWSEDAIVRLGEALRRLHDLTASFDPGPDAVWAPWFARSLPGRRPVLGHGDLGPWNILARDGMPTAFIDWDTAGPVDAMWELAQVAWLNVQLHDDDVAELQGLPSPAARARQLALFLDAYGLERDARVSFVDHMIEFAIRSARDEAIVESVGPDTPSPSPRGFPVVWAITWRTRAAAWLFDHRADLQAAIT